jgi:membrane-associated phospholipid phosphatase
VLTAAWAITISLALQSAPPTLTPASTPWPDDQPFVRALPNFWQDLKRLPSVRSLEIGAVGTAVTFALAPADDKAADAARNSEPSSYTKIGNALGDGWVQGGAAVATYVIGRSIHDAETTHIGSDLVRAQILNGILTGAIKLAADRTRPNGGSHAFPSGHSSATFATAAVAASHFGWKVGLPAYAFSGFVGWCRVRDLQHWVTDTAAGATLGIVVGTTVAAGHRDREWQIVPTKTAGGFAVYVVKTR